MSIRIPLILFFLFSNFNILGASSNPIDYYPAQKSGLRLTPHISSIPRINSPELIAVKPNADFVFRIPISGERPFNFQVENLPDGVKLDDKVGFIYGKLKGKGSYSFKISVKNSHGSDSKIIKIRCGGPLLATPPMGWNSWYSYSEAVSQAGIEKVIRAMHTSGLADHGWAFINIDDCWQGTRGGKYNSIQSNERFPNMKELCNYAHSLGLKIGIYSTPWMGTYAGFIGGSSPNPEGDYSKNYIQIEKRGQKNQVFGRYPGTLRAGMGKVGPYWMFDNDAKQFSDWGFDYIKVDWQPNDISTTKKIFEGLATVERGIVLSLSNAAPYENMEELSCYANLTRTTHDIQDNWASICGIGFSQEKWQKFLKPGHYPDPDILQVGKIATPNQLNTHFRNTNLKPDEQYTQISLWALLSAPFLISCDIENLDEFTEGLLVNDEVIAIQQDIAAFPAKCIYKKSGLQIWKKDLNNGEIALGFFNLNDKKSVFEISVKDLNLNGKFKVRDLWRQKNIGEFKNSFLIELNAHGCTLFRVF